MLQHWDEHGRIGESIRFGQRSLEYLCAALSLLFVLTVVHFPWESSTIKAVERPHRVLIDVNGDRFANAVTDVDCARVVHSAPDPRIVTVRSRLPDVAVSAVRLTGGRQCKNLL